MKAIIFDMDGVIFDTSVSAIRLGGRRLKKWALHR